MTIKEDCQRLFKTDNLYEVLQLARRNNISVADVKVAYYRAAMFFQPDNGPVDNSEATEKFQLLSKVYSILVDKEKRHVYDNSGHVPNDVVCESNCDWYSVWNKLFRDKGIVAFYKQYIGSTKEKEDLKRHYNEGDGKMDYIMTKLWCVRYSDEDRVTAMLNGMIASGELRDNPNFSREPVQKKWARRAWGEKQAEAAVESMCEIIRKGGDMTVEEAISADQKRPVAERWADVVDQPEFHAFCCLLVGELEGVHVDTGNHRMTDQVMETQAEEIKERGAAQAVDKGKATGEETTSAISKSGDQPVEDDRVGNVDKMAASKQVQPE